MKGALMRSEKREYFRVSIDQLTSIIKNSDGNYEVVDKSTKPLVTDINIKDVSVGGLHIESAKDKFKKGTSCEIVLPKVKDLDGKKLKCEVTRASFVDGRCSYDVGLRFIPPNTDYLKQFVEIIKTHYME
tara:strand:- start:97 stop:486 length:390 start_codon:yes stop_codon:yes gene_type:complete